jgi:hypothetical protein
VSLAHAAGLTLRQRAGSGVVRTSLQLRDAARCAQPVTGWAQVARPLRTDAPRSKAAAEAGAAIDAPASATLPSGASSSSSPSAAVGAAAVDDDDDGAGPAVVSWKEAGTESPGAFLKACVTPIRLAWS